jgi:hypothetical protein
MGSVLRDFHKHWPTDDGVTHVEDVRAASVKRYVAAKYKPRKVSRGALIPASDGRVDTSRLRGEEVRHLAFSNSLLKETKDGETTHDGRNRHDPYAP